MSSRRPGGKPPPRTVGAWIPGHCGGAAVARLALGLFLGLWHGGCLAESLGPGSSLTENEAKGVPAESAATRAPAASQAESPDHPVLTQLLDNLVALPGGRLQVGENAGLWSRAHPNEGPRHPVTIAPFRLSRFEITRQQWETVMGTAPWGPAACETTCPADRVSWDDAQAFVRRVNAMTGRALRLPTEREWEYAARLSEAVETGSNCLDCGSPRGGRSPTPVGHFLVNPAVGLADLRGNVWEWVEDSYTLSYADPPDPRQPAKVLRGGSYLTPSLYLRPSYRNREARHVALPSFGFRVAETIHEEAS